MACEFKLRKTKSFIQGNFTEVKHVQSGKGKCWISKREYVSTLHNSFLNGAGVLGVVFRHV